MLLAGDGSFSIPNVESGPYDVAIEIPMCLTKMITTSINFPATDLGTIDMVGGDINADNAIYSLDLDIFADVWGETGQRPELDMIGTATRSENRARR